MNDYEDMLLENDIAFIRRLSEENEKLWKLVDAVQDPDYGGSVYMNDIEQKNWYDFRDDLRKNE